MIAEALNNTGVLIWAIASIFIGFGVRLLIGKWLKRSILIVFISCALLSYRSTDYKVEFDKSVYETSSYHEYYENMKETGKFYVKNNVSIESLSDVLHITIPMTAHIFKSVVGSGYTPTITSANDSEHSVNSKHYSNLALDWRINDISEVQAIAVYKSMSKFFGSNYKVLLEDVGIDNAHIHIEFVGYKNMESLYKAYIAYKSFKNDLNPNIVIGLVSAESSFNPDAMSKSGAIGLMQLMPSTAEMLGVNPHVPSQNIEGGIKYVKSLVSKYNGRTELALIAYHCGHGHVDKSLSIYGLKNWASVLAQMEISDENKRLTSKYVSKIIDYKAF